MRYGVLTTALLAVALQGCGGGNTNGAPSGTPPAGAAQQQPVATPSAQGAAATPSTVAKPAKTGSTSKIDTSAMASGTTFVPSAKPGRRPAVLLATGGGAAATAEAQQLAKLGVGTLVLDGAPTLKRLRDALSALRADAQVDGNIGVIAEGEAATTAARFAVATPGLGAVVLSNPTARVEQPLRRISSAHVMLQRGEDSRTMTDALAKRLVIAAPVGTLLHSFVKLGNASRSDRDRWALAMLTT